MPSLVLQLLTRSRVDTLPALFDSLAQQTDQDWKLFVLVNGPDPSMREEIRRILLSYQSKLRVMKVFENHDNAGFAGGHQQLFAMHHAPYVLLVNDDVVCAPDYIQRLRLYVDAHPHVAAVSGKLLRPDRHVDSLGLTLSITGKVSNMLEGKKDPGSFVKPFDVFGVPGTLVLLRREAVLAASPDGTLFDPAFGSYKEDVDLAFRLRASGWRSVVIPTAVAVHHRTFRRSFLHRGVSFYASAHSYRNHWWNLLMFYSFKDMARTGVAWIPFECAKFLFLLCTRPRVIFWSFVTTKAHWAHLMRKRRYYQMRA